MLGNVLINSILHLSAAMPTALPFLIRLAAVPDIAVCPGLFELWPMSRSCLDLSTKARRGSSATSAITRNGNGAGPRSPHTPLSCARCWRTRVFRTDYSAWMTASAYSRLWNHSEPHPESRGPALVGTV